MKPRSSFRSNSRWLGKYLSFTFSSNVKVLFSLSTVIVRLCGPLECASLCVDRTTIRMMVFRHLAVGFKVQLTIF